MDIKLYAIRAVKSIVYIAVIFVVLLLLVFTLSEKKDPNITFMEAMVPKQNQLTMVAFVLVFGLIYPALTFMKKTVALSKPFGEFRESIIAIFESAGYVLTSDRDKKLFFRPKRKLTRFMRMMEDTIEVDYADNPIIIDGMRRDAFRLAKHIEYLVARTEENE